MPYASVNGIEMYYEEHGSGVPLVLVHGFFRSCRDWDDVVPVFAARYRVILPDLRGHGCSASLPGTIRFPMFADDLVALLDHLEIARAHFIGHSGGGIALVCAGTQYQERVRSLTLVAATYAFDETAVSRMHEEVADHEAMALPDGAEAQARKRSLVDAFRAYAEFPGGLPFRPEDLRAITAPVLVSHGDRDRFFPVHIPVAMYGAMPNAELCILPATGHSLPVEHPDLFVSLTLQFLERQRDA
jgi:pimeloyl-ACP methyl ester carboxylesterase